MPAWAFLFSHHLDAEGCCALRALRRNARLGIFVFSQSAVARSPRVSPTVAMPAWAFLFSHGSSVEGDDAPDKPVGRNARLGIFVFSLTRQVNRLEDEAVRSQCPLGHFCFLTPLRL